MAGASGRTRPATKFDEVYVALVERIEEEEEPPYKPGAALPAASTLAMQFGVSAATIMKVTKQLKDDGYLVPSGHGYPPRVRRRHPGDQR